LLDIFEDEKVESVVERKYKVGAILKKQFVVFTKRMLKIFFKKRFLKAYWRWHNYNLTDLELFLLIEYLLLLIEKKLFKKKIICYLDNLFGLYSKKLEKTKKLEFLFLDEKLNKHAILKFFFSKQQIFFQLFVNNDFEQSTHTTVGTLVRIREDILLHNDTTISIKQLEKLKDKELKIRQRPKNFEDQTLKDIFDKTLKVKIPEKKIKTVKKKKKKKKKKFVMILVYQMYCTFYTKT